MALIQSANGANNGNLGSILGTFSSNTTAGNLIVVAVAQNNPPFSGILSGISDSNSNVYSQACIGSASAAGMDVWYAQNIAGGSCILTGTMDSNRGTVALYAREYSGLQTNSVLDQEADRKALSSVIISGTTATTTNANDLLYLVSSVSNGTETATFSGGFGNLGTSTGVGTITNGILIFAADKLVSATGAYVGTITPNNTDSFQAAILAFKQISVGGGFSPSPAAAFGLLGLSM